MQLGGLRLAGLILVVEDDECTLKLLSDILKVIGYRVITAMNGVEAIESASKDKPDLITMDIQLPLMNGVDAVRVLKSNPATANIPIIAITASAMNGQEQTALNAGCILQISKPFDIDFLIKKIDDNFPRNKMVNHI
jgi:two-component system cell cycle response regulator DivK